MQEKLSYTIKPICKTQIEHAMMRHETVQNPPPSACLSAVALFADLPEADMMRLNQNLPLKKIAAGAMVFDPARREKRLFIVKSGRIRLFQVAPSGKALTMAIIEAGNVFGEMPLLGQSMGNNYAEAMEASEVCMLNEAQIAQHFLADPRIAFRVAQILGERVQALESRLADAILKPLPQRIAGLLLQLAQESLFRKAVVNLTHEQLAQIAGATREATSKILSQFAQQGLIRQSRGKIVLLERTKLQHLRNEAA